MKRPLNKAVRALFEARMRDELPMFRDTTGSHTVPDGMRIYEFDVADNLTLLVILCPNQKKDTFTVELGWSRDKRLPGSTFSPAAPTENDGARIRMPRLWTDYDKWWWLGPDRDEEFRSIIRSGASAEAITEHNDRIQADFLLTVEDKMPYVDPQVADAFARLMEHGLPYFNRAAMDCGYPPPFPHRDNA